jgi:MFS family permease
MSERLFTPRFLTMFVYTFTVFVSLFQLLPTAPYHILDLGGSMAVAGLFHGLLTYASAFSAPMTGPLSDRIGHRPVLIAVSLGLAALTMSYAFIHDYHVLFLVVIAHGLIWSALLSASGAYMTAAIPPSRRGEGLGYWGLANVLAFGAAPILGFWVYHHGWITLCVEMTALNLLMAAIAWLLPDDRAEAEAARRELAAADRAVPGALFSGIHNAIAWRVLLLAIGMSALSLGYGAITSFSSLFADAQGVAPRSLFLTVMAAATVIGRLTIGRALDRIGHRRVLLPSLVAPSIGLFLLAVASGPGLFIASAIVFGVGFGLMYPAYAAYIMNHVAPSRRGAAFGAILAAFDTGIGTGASLMGWVISAYGFRMAFALTGVVGLLSLPYFLLAETRLGFMPPTRG